ncbi:MAG TPA: DUF86 domain-containing protein [Thermoanaerobaculia bacterium]|nr:DUF86 domain-containing protein [Thermoanaerobaculia bacterium]
MSPEREWRFRIEHIVEAIEKIMRYTEAMTYEQFAADERTVDAVIRNFLVIGEATRNVPDHVRASAAGIPWKLMEGMRHVLVHDYDAVRLDTVWQTVREDLPPLIAPLRRLVA